MTKDKKLSDFDRRKLHYQKLWGISEKPLNKYEGDLRSDMRRWVDEADKEKAQEKKNKLSKATPTKPASDGITKSRIFLEKIRGDFDND